MKYSKSSLHFISQLQATAVCISGSSPAIGGDCTVGTDVATATCTTGAGANTDCNLGLAANVSCVIGTSVSLNCVTGGDDA